MAAVQATSLRGIGRLQLHCHTIALFRSVHSLVVKLHGRDAPQVHPTLRWNGDGRPNLQHSPTQLLPQALKKSPQFKVLAFNWQTCYRKFQGSDLFEDMIRVPRYLAGSRCFTIGTSHWLQVSNVLLGGARPAILRICSTNSCSLTSHRQCFTQCLLHSAIAEILGLWDTGTGAPWLCPP